MTRIVRGLAALAVLAILLVGVPWALVTLGGNPVPAGPWSLEAITSALTGPSDGALLLGVLTIAAWIGWFTFAVSVLLEVPSQLARTRAPRLPGLALPQAGARVLVSAVLGLVALGVTPAVATAGTAPATLSATVATSQSTTAPAAAKVTAPTEAIATGQKVHLPRATTAETKAETKADVEAEVEDITVQVIAGDTLWELAEQHLGDGSRYPEIAAANPHLVTDPDLIHIGWQLAVPDAQVDDDNSTAGSDDPAQVEPVVDQANVDALTGAAQHATEISTTLQATAADVHEAQEAAQHAQNDPETPAQASGDSQQAAQPAARSAGTLSPLPVQGSTTVPTPTQDITTTTGSDQDPLRTILGIGALSAAGALALLHARRSAQSRRRRPGRRIAMPTGAAADLETQLHTNGDPLAVDDLDHALRSLTSWAHHTSTPMPAIRAARITVDELELYLTHEDAHLPSPFQDTQDPGTWVLGREGLHDLLPAEDLADVPAPCPALVTLGQDEMGGWVLVNLEEVGSLAIAADAGDQQAVLAALALELVGSSWADDLRLTLVGVLPDLADVLGSDRIEHIPSLDRVLAGVLHASDVHSRTLVAAGHASVITARGSMEATETWTPHLLLLGQDPTPEQHTELAQLLASTPRLAVATITTSPRPLSEWVLRVQPRGQALLDPAGVTLTPQRIDETEYAALLEAFATTWADDVDGPAWASTLTHEPDITTLAIPSTAQDEVTTGLQPVPPTTHQEHDTATQDTEVDLAGEGDLVDQDEDDGATDDHTLPDTEEAEEYLEQDRPPVPADPELPVDNQDSADEDDAQVVADVEPHGQTALPATAAAELKQPAPMVRLLGPVEVQRAQGRRPQSPGRATELVAYLALHPTSSHEPLDEAMWPGKRMDATRRNTPVSQARTWLGTAPDGRPYVGLVDEDGYRLVGVTTDWELFCQTIGPDISAVPTTGLRAALNLVTGQPMSGVNPRYYAWAEADKQEMIATVADVAHELSTRALSSGDATLAAWAAAKGLAAEPASELLWRDQLRAAWLSAVPGRVDEVAAHLTETLEPIGGDMEPETIELLAQLLNGDTDRRSHG